MSKELEALDRIFNGMSNNVGYIKYFEDIRQALTELEDLKKEVKDRQETEDSLTRWVAELTEENAELKKKVK